MSLFRSALPLASVGVGFAVVCMATVVKASQTDTTAMAIHHLANYEWFSTNAAVGLVTVARNVSTCVAEMTDGRNVPTDSARHLGLLLYWLSSMRFCLNDLEQERREVDGVMENTVRVLCEWIETRNDLGSQIESSTNSATLFWVCAGLQSAYQNPPVSAPYSARLAHALASADESVNRWLTRGGAPRPFTAESLVGYACNLVLRGTNAYEVSDGAMSSLVDALCDRPHAVSSDMAFMVMLVAHGTGTSNRENVWNKQFLCRFRKELALWWPVVPQPDYDACIARTFSRLYSGGDWLYRLGTKQRRAFEQQERIRAEAELKRSFEEDMRRMGERMDRLRTDR